MFFGSRFQYSLYKSNRRKKSTILKIVKFFLIAIILYELITGLFITTVNVNSNSMSPLLHKDNRMLIFKPAYRQHILNNRFTLPGIGRPNRGDIVIYHKNFARDYPWYLKPVNSVINFFTLQKRELGTRHGYGSRVNISRIVGIPGDTIIIRNNVAHIMPGGRNNFVTEFELTQNKYDINISSFPANWDRENNPFSLGGDEIKIGDGYYFIMGDNRELYFDSRSSGLVPVQSIKGRVILRYWPLRMINVF
ncbi:MAG: signal peptidase I [Spirochaetaceae bacterium]|nr:signal peptidase I [Spirochaetaceae bacterium]